MNKIKGIMILLVLSLALIACTNTAVNENEDIFKIGVIQFASHPALDQAFDGFMQALEDAGLKENEDFVIDYQNAQGDSATAETIATKFVSEKPDLIYAIATPAAQAVAHKTSDIPIVVSAVTDPASAGLVDTNEKGNTNVVGVSDLTPVREQIKILKDLIPNAKKVAVIYTNSEDNSRFQADIAKTELEALGLEFVEASISEGNQIQQMSESLVGKVDAIYVPTDNLVSESFTIVSKVANQNKIPTIVGEIAMVHTGGLITFGINYLNVGVNAGVLAIEILVNQQNPKEMGIVFLSEDDLEFAINASTKKQLEISIDEAIEEQAIIIE